MFDNLHGDQTKKPRKLKALPLALKDSPGTAKGETVSTFLNCSLSCPGGSCLEAEARLPLGGVGLYP